MHPFGWSRWTNVRVCAKLNVSVNARHLRVTAYAHASYLLYCHSISDSYKTHRYHYMRQLCGVLCYLAVKVIYGQLCNKHRA